MPEKEAEATRRSRRPRAPWLQVPWPCLLVFALVWAFFGRTVGFEFLNWDDNLFVRDNPLVTTPGWKPYLEAVEHSQADYYAPVLWWAFRIQHSLWGLDPAGYHAVNAALHALNAALLAALLLRLGFSPVAAFFSAGLWALHPLRTESVAWITELKDVLSLFFCLLSAWFYLNVIARGEGGEQSAPRRDYFLALLFFLLAVGSKATVVVWPVVLMLYESYRRAVSGPADGASDLKAIARRMADGALASVRRLAPMFLIAILFGVLMVHFQTHEPPVVGRARGAHLSNCMVACYSIMFHTKKLLWPVRLNAVYVLPVPIPYSPVFPDTGLADARVYLSAVVVTLLAAAILIASLRTMPWLSFAIAFYLVGMLPLMQIIPTGRPLADRYLYLPSIALCACVGHAIVGFMVRRRVAASHVRLAAVFVCTLIGLACTSRLGVWRDSLSLWSDVLSKNPAGQIGHGNFALGLIEEGRFEEARPHALAAIAAQPSNYRPYLLLGRVESFLGHEAEAAKACSDYLERWQPQLEGTQFECELAKLCMQQRLHETALAVAGSAGRRAKWLPDMRVRAEVLAKTAFVQANTLLLCRRYDECLSLVAETEREMLGWPMGRLLAGRALMHAGRYDEAAAAFREWEATGTAPPAQVVSWLAQVELERGNGAAAARLCTDGLARRPRDFLLHKTLSEVYSGSGDYKRALPHARKAARLCPNELFVDANLAWVLHNLGRRRKAWVLMDRYADSIWLRPLESYQFGVILFSMGFRERAAGFLRASLRWGSVEDEWRPNAQALLARCPQPKPASD